MGDYRITIRKEKATGRQKRTNERKKDKRNEGKQTTRRKKETTTPPQYFYNEIQVITVQVLTTIKTTPMTEHAALPARNAQKTRVIRKSVIAAITGPQTPQSQACFQPQAVTTTTNVKIFNVIKIDQHLTARILKQKPLTRPNTKKMPEQAGDETNR